MRRGILPTSASRGTCQTISKLHQIVSLEEYAEQYRVDMGREIGRGYFGTVSNCHVYDMSSGTYIKHQFVVKLCSGLGNWFDRDGIVKEAKILKKVHPNELIIEVNSNGCPGIVMPNFGGLTLEKLLSSGCDLSLVQRKSIALQLLQQVMRLHQAGYIHTDIKLNNILVSRRGDGSLKATLIDFGNARPLYSTGRIGTPSYQHNDSYKAVFFKTYASQKIDVYALGIVLKKVMGEQCLRQEKEILLLLKRCGVADPNQRPYLNELIERFDETTVTKQLEYSAQ